MGPIYIPSSLILPNAYKLQTKFDWLQQALWSGVNIKDTSEILLRLYKAWPWVFQYQIGTDLKNDDRRKDNIYRTIQSSRWKNSQIIDFLNERRRSWLSTASYILYTRNALAFSNEKEVGKEINSCLCSRFLPYKWLSRYLLRWPHIFKTVQHSFGDRTLICPGKKIVKTNM